MKYPITKIVLLLFFSGEIVPNFSQPIIHSGEKHITHIRQLTFGGDNAESYFSFNEKYFVFQSNNSRWSLSCDQIFLFDLSVIPDSLYKPIMLSTGKGRTTCSYFLPDNKHILFASTHLGNIECPVSPEHISGGKYLWPIYKDYDIFMADLNGKITGQLTKSAGYDAEAVVSPSGNKIAFTSVRSGDLDIWTMDLDGNNVKQITNTLGYDGGAMFSPDGKKLVFRSSRPNNEDEIKEYKELLEKGLVAPTALEIFTCNIDGSDIKQITNLGKANWSPSFHPSGKKIVFSSNHHSKKGFDFQLFMINIDGTDLEQITNESLFNSFPVFSPNGKKIIFSSNRNNKGTHDTNVFMADWVD